MDYIVCYLSDLPSKRRKTGPPQPKNPISTLNELRPGLLYKTLAMDGPSHAPVFTVCVEVCTWYIGKLSKYAFS